MSTIERLSLYMRNKGLNNNQLTQQAGLSVGLIGKAISSNTGINSNSIEKILYAFPDINAEWLLTGNGSMTKILNEFNEPPSVYKLRTDRTIKEQMVPLYDLEASAGIVELFKDSKTKSKPVDFISIPNLPKCDGAVHVTGDSMYPLLKSGDIVMYKKLANCIDSILYGEMYLLSIDLQGEEYISVKWIHRSEKGDEFIKLVSQNTHHQPKDVHLSKVTSLALIKASIRINSMV